MNALPSSWSVVVLFFLMIRRPPRSTLDRSSAASDVYKRQVLEAKIERGKGIMTTALIQNGTLRLGDTMLVGEHYGRIKAMYDYTGKRIQTAAPSTPVSVSGLDGMPQAGEQFRVCLLYTSPSPRDRTRHRMPSSA